MVKEKQVTATTWKLRLLILFAAVSLVWVSSPVWLVAIGNSLLHEDQLKPADIILVENYDTEYAVYETAHSLVEAGLSSRVLVPVRVQEERHSRKSSSGPPALTAGSSCRSGMSSR
jgi:hypothetical protein